ncbi:MAG: hypothetical protein ACK6EB_11710, partial [Planctomyces sp.]
EQLNPQRVHRIVGKPGDLEGAEEQTSESDLDADDDSTQNTDLDVDGPGTPLMVAELRPSDIRDYVKSLKASAVHWFTTFYPELTDGLTRT